MYKIIVNGNCVVCGKELTGNELFLCEQCREEDEDGDQIKTESVSYVWEDT